MSLIIYAVLLLNPEKRDADKKKHWAKEKKTPGKKRKKKCAMTKPYERMWLSKNAIAYETCASVMNLNVRILNRFIR